MNVLYIIGFLIGAFILVTIFTFARAYFRAASLNPEAREQCMYWRTMHNNAFADGDHLAAKLYKAKELVVHATNHPISAFGGSVPLLCVEGQLESKVRRGARRAYRESRFSVQGGTRGATQVAMSKIRHGQNKPE